MNLKERAAEKIDSVNVIYTIVKVIGGFRIT